MKTVHIHQAEIIEFEERDTDYLGLIETMSTEHGLQTYIMLMDYEEKVKLCIGSILTKEYNLSESHEYAINMLSDEDYCDSVWEHNKVIE